jgi:hypothetical protein
MPLPRIAFVTTCRGRLQHLQQTLPQNLIDNQTYENCIFVVLDYNSPDGLLQYMVDHHGKDILSGRMAYYRTDEPRSFHMAHAKNMAHRCGMLEGADILVNLDADGYTGPNFAAYIAHEFTQERGVFLQSPWNRWVGGEWLCEEHDGSLGPPVDKGCNGRMAYTTDAFLLAGGYDEKFSSWSPDDKDLNIRLRRLGHVPKVLPRKFVRTILHNNRMRFKEYPQARKNHGRCFDIKLDDSCDTIANFGKIGCGTVFRNFWPRPMELKPLPTRVFGIGMHKTATTSLHLAMRELGFNSAHWTSAHWAKALWREMNNFGRSLLVEKHYHLCDLPIQLLYRKLDQAYPGSKFILTMTNEDAWIKAAELHWDASHNPMRAYWDHDPFTNRIHSVLYGREDFDRETFVQRYRHHNADVLHYFRDRPDDLLVMNMSDGAGYPELCGFLGKPVPSRPYPHGNNDAELAKARHWIHAGDGL